MNKSILLHDYFSIRGGGERLAIILAQQLNLDLAFAYWLESSYDKNLLNSQLFDLKGYTSIPGWLTLKQMNAFRYNTAFIKNYNTVIYSGIDAPLAVHNHLNGKNIYYCHTPPRFIYDKKAFYLSQAPAWLRFAHQLRIAYMKKHYEAAVNHMDIIVANSQHISQRIKKYLGKSSTVIYPPCDTELFQWQGQEDFYLSTARLDSLKRVDLIIKAFLKMPDKKLIVTSGGSEFKALKRLAGNATNIKFTGWLSESKLRELLGKCIATIYVPMDEDFGMSPVESMAAGKPVIGVAEGGLKETIVDDETGFLLSANNFNDTVIINAVNKLTPKLALEMKISCETRASLFSQEIFLENILLV
jgi:glycosyltransferase involved in cell wall biosynthesis